MGLGSLNGGVPVEIQRSKVSVFGFSNFLRNFPAAGKCERRLKRVACRVLYRYFNVFAPLL